MLIKQGADSHHNYLYYHRVLYHTYADDTQLYVKFDRKSPSSMQIAINRLEDCLLDVSHWMAHNGLELNNDKTEWLIFNGNPEFSKSVTLTVGAETIKQNTSIRNLGVRLEPDITMLPHINDTCRSGYYHLRRINKIKKYLSDCGARTLIQALVISRMNYCNSIYNGLPIKLVVAGYPDL